MQQNRHLGSTDLLAIIVVKERNVFDKKNFCCMSKSKHFVNFNAANFVEN